MCTIFILIIAYIPINTTNLAIKSTIMVQSIDKNYSNKHGNITPGGILINAQAVY